MFLLCKCSSLQNEFAVSCMECVTVGHRALASRAWSESFCERAKSLSP